MIVPILNTDVQIVDFLSGSPTKKTIVSMGNANVPFGALITGTYTLQDGHVPRVIQ
jgi:hypothetical protein